ncbi:MAG: ABC transporter permease subunit [Campylobacterales bacterium]|nr:ABC transporter permease subunit [Campylobacterales bacterium]
MNIELSQILPPLLLSLQTVGVSAILFLSIGVPLAYLLSSPKLRLRWLLDALVTLPLIFPPIAVGFFLLLLLGKNGWIGSFFAHFNIAFVFSFYGLVVAGFISGLPLMVKPLQSAIELFPKNVKEASYISGKSGVATLIYVVLPTIKKSLFAALLIACARALGEVGITLMLGGNIIGKTDTISLAIYNAVFDGDHQLALVLSSILMAISLLFFIILHILQKDKSL